MLRIQRGDSIVEVKGRGPNYQVLKINTGSLRHLLAMDSSRELRYLKRHRINSKRVAKLIDKILSSLPIGISSGAIDAVRELDYGNNG